jgi:hypothetical protein
MGMHYKKNKPKALKTAGKRYKSKRTGAAMKRPTNAKKKK